MITQNNKIRKLKKMMIITSYKYSEIFKIKLNQFQEVNNKQLQIIM